MSTLPNIYLDIDGVLLANDITPANYANEFIQHCVANYPTYWLTTHCKGDASVPFTRFAHLFEPETIAAMRQIRPTDWDLAKTEGIDFDRPFLWFDDDLFIQEQNDLEQHSALDSWIQVDLVRNENQLQNFIISFPLPTNIID